MGFDLQRAAVMCLLLGTTPAAAQLAPHRAFYELSLNEMSGGLVEARGAFAIEWRSLCEGSTSQQRLWFVGRTEDGVTFDYDVRFSTWEAADNSAMEFTMRSFAAGELVEEFRGRASMPADGGSGRAVYTVPEGSEVALPPGTVFPTRHLSQLIELAHAGERVASFALFDGAGSADDALANVTAVIGDPRKDQTSDSATIDEPAVSDDPAWPMALAYHEVFEDGLGTPEFEISFDLAANGVMRRLLLDYGDFALRATLNDIEMLSLPHCE